MMRHKNGVKAIGFTLLIAALLAGCAGGSAADRGEAKANLQAESSAPKQLKVKAFFADSDLDKLLEREAVISFRTDNEKYIAALQLLRQTPDEAASSLFKGVTFKSASGKDGNVVVDLSISPEGRLGAPGELLMVEALKKSLFQFEEVQTIELLVDGKRTESLMGHVGLTYPIKRE